MAQEPRRHTATILVVDDEANNVDLVTRVLLREGHVVHSASNGRDALEAMARIKPDLLVMDVMMPGITGFDVCRELKQRAETRLTPIVLITGLNAPEDRIRGIAAGADDFLTKPFNAHELIARVRSLIRLKRYTDELDSAESVILSLALTIEARDASTEGHCQRLASYAMALGIHLDLPDDDLAALHRGGFLHDVGKISVPDAVLLKPAPLTPDEFEIMKQHTLTGDRLCGHLRSLEKVRPIVRHHHERLDGSGYPDGLAGDAVPLLAQLMSVVDVYDALTTMRPYKPAQPAEEAFAELRREVQKGWRRRDLVDEFIDIGQSGRLSRLMREHSPIVPRS